MENSYLIHSAKGTSWQKGNHKYLWKEKKNGRWYYFYRGNNQNVGYEGVSTKGYLSAIEDAYGQLSDLKGELGNSKRDKEQMKSVNRDMARVARDRRKYIESTNYHKFMHEASNILSIGKKFINTIKNIPEKQRIAGENYKQFASKYKDYFK